MRIEVIKEFKDKNSEKRKKGEVINVKKDDGLTEDLVENIISKGFATEKLEEVPEITTEDVYVKSYTEWWKEIYEELKDKKDLSSRQLVDACNQIVLEVGRAKRQDKIKNQKEEKISENNKSQSNNSKPASDKQKNYLDSLGVDYESDINRDMASDLIERELDKQNATEKQKNALKKANAWKPGMSKKEASEKLDEIYSD